MASRVTVERLGDEQARRQNANILYFDMAIRHQVGVRNLTTQQVNELTGVLERADRELTDRLRTLLNPLVGKPVDARTEQYRRLLTQIKAARSVTLRELETDFENNLINLAQVEEEFERRMMGAALPVELDLRRIPAELLIALVKERPISSGPNGALTLHQWFQNLERADYQRILGAVQQGLLLGEGVPAILQRVIGTRDMFYRDGVSALTRMNAEAIIRTAINSISNGAREEVWNANDDILDYLMWTSVLDGRTSDICRSRDGKIVNLRGGPAPRGHTLLEPQTARPPAHVNCRSIMVAVFSIGGIVERIGERPFVRSVDTPRKREINFRTMAREKYGEEWGGMTTTQRREAIRSEKTRWARTNIGQVPASTTYQEWLKNQPADFQDQVLGKTKGKLFRTGKITVDEFVTTQGNAITLKQLAETHPEVFRAAGLSS